MKIFGHRFFDHAKDGGPESCVDGYWLVEIKGLFSVAILRFGDGSRDSYHSHAFNSLTWIISGLTVERCLGRLARVRRPSIVPVVTRRSTFHRVVSIGVSWAVTVRGPWAKTWQEFDPRTGARITLAHGRKVVTS